MQKRKRPHRSLPPDSLLHFKNELSVRRLLIGFLQVPNLRPLHDGDVGRFPDRNPAHDGKNFRIDAFRFHRQIEPYGNENDAKRAKADFFERQSFQRITEVIGLLGIILSSSKPSQTFKRYGPEGVQRAIGKPSGRARRREIFTHKSGAFFTLRRWDPAATYAPGPCPAKYFRH